MKKGVLLSRSASWRIALPARPRHHHGSPSTPKPGPWCPEGRAPKQRPPWILGLVVVVVEMERSGSRRDLRPPKRIWEIGWFQLGFLEALVGVCEWRSLFDLEELLEKKKKRRKRVRFMEECMYVLRRLQYKKEDEFSWSPGPANQKVYGASVEDFCSTLHKDGTRKYVRRKEMEGVRHVNALDVGSTWE